MNKITNYYTTIIVVATIILPSISLAQVSSQQLPMDRILDQKKLERQQKKLFEKPKTGERKKIIKKTKRTGEYCIKIKKVEFLKATKLSKKAKKNLTEKVLDKCIFNDQIGDLLGDTTNYYIGDGYTNARAYFKAFDDKSGTLTLLISEGIINSIKLNDIKPNKKSMGDKDQDKSEKKDGKIGISFFDKAQIFFAFPTRKGNVFNIADIEQGVSNMNRLRSNNTVIDSRPAEENGMSNIVVNNYKNPNSLELGVNYDNSGSKSTGVYNVTYSINKDNLLKINDNIGFSQIKSQRSETNIANISIPFGYYTFGYSDVSNEYTSFSGGIKVGGTSTNHDFSLARLLYRSKTDELNINTNLNLRNSTRIESGVVRLLSQRLSTGRIGLDYRTSFKNNLTIYTGFTYSKGLKIHSAIDDQKLYGSSVTKDTPRSQFEKFSYNLSLYKPFGKYLNYSLQANGQHSADSLYSSELLYVGGSRYTVRGLPYDGINGSKGAYIRNDLNINLSSILTTFEIKQDQENHNKFTNKAISILQNTHPYIFYDYGFTRAIVRSDENAKTEYISGAGLGLKYYGKYISGEVSYAANINSPEYVIENNDYQNSAIYFGISGKYWLW
ncbi:POTRA domain-containing protein [Rickettsiales bacterium]|nr:POTRA domain-containing protein [Rickettsiales bacterium]